MKKMIHSIFILFFISMLNFGCMGKEKIMENRVNMVKIDGPQLTYMLSSPRKIGNITVEEALSHRRSHRSFLKEAISAEDLSQILWAAYGITQPLTGYPQTRGGLRTAPSAGALYPLELYVLIGNVKDIEPGIYKYSSQEHKITRINNRDVKKELSNAALNQEMISIAPACLFYSAVYSRTTQKYGNRGRERYVCIDLGHSAQNVYLQAEALHLGTCSIGAFDDAKVREVMQLPENEEPLYIMPIGRYYNRPEF
jgi:SagB-type dehydrogenase family enzyme